VGSWWASTFDQLRNQVTAVKNARNWQLPTSYGSRSTVSGLGTAIHPQGKNRDWVPEGLITDFWQNQRGTLFSGSEQLNATEVVKRTLHLKGVLTKILLHKGEAELNINLKYPDLTSGVAGWLKTLTEKDDQQAKIAIDRYQKVTESICTEFPWTQNVSKEAWGIPWIDNRDNNNLHYLNPRLISPGWLIEELEEKETRSLELNKLQQTVQSHFPPGNNPTDWYVLAVGDGDGMGNWLKGNYLDTYGDYIPEALREKIDRIPDPQIREPLKEFIKAKKRMGPSSHSALSRALLDFSNKLVPYLTEERYAGKLIYSGGDYVLAYSNLWEWDRWLWDIRQCFKGAKDDGQEFENQGNYWQYQDSSKGFNRPLFTMGSKATISFGLVIANSSVPLAIALENMRAAEEEAKEHFCGSLPKGKRKKDALQVRVLYGNGNVLKATAKFDVFNTWKELINNCPNLEPALLEQSAQVWQEHPVPVEGAIAPWVKAFCDRRQALQDDQVGVFSEGLTQLITELWQSTEESDRDREIRSWLKLGAFILRKRNITLGGDK
jgi:CRISPR-associated protein Cmr2